MIDKIQRLKLRDVWHPEPKFTEWLEQNIDVLGECIGINFENLVACGKSVRIFL